MRRALILAPVLMTGLLAACIAEEGESVTEGEPCGAAAYADLVGKNLAAVTLPAELNTRVIRPGSMVTQDYVPERLNIELDEGGVITRLRCG